MIGDLFDSPWKILIIAIVILVLFGSRKMPDAARSLGRSMRILKAEVREMHEEGASGTQDGQPAQAAQTPWQPQPVPPQLDAPVAPAPGVHYTAPPAAAPAPGVQYTAPPAAAPVPGVPVAPPVAPAPGVPVPEAQQDIRPV
jgi:sec-independent protein translocase protein TatA